MPRLIVLTGATGFVGRAVLRCALERRVGQVRTAGRRLDVSIPSVVKQVVVGDIGIRTDWRLALRDASTIVHCAARVHIMHEDSANPLADFRAVNVDGTLRLARQAIESGASRFIFVSSVKVCGESSAPGRPIRALDEPQPADPYGVSKCEAERALLALGAESGLEVVVVRPVLVYGPGVGANFLRLMRWIHRGIPLPLGAIYNRRSFVGVDNLADLLVTCIHHPQAAGQTFMVSDGEDVSTTKLMTSLASALKVSPRLLPVPASVLSAGSRLMGCEAAVQRLVGWLQVDIAETRLRLGWSPRFSLNEGLQGAAADYLNRVAR